MDELDKLLWNWARYVKSSRFKVSKSVGGPQELKAVSIETRFSNPQGKGNPTGWGDYTMAALRDFKVPFDRAEAEKIEKVMPHLLHRNRLMLKFHYIYEANPYATARKLRFPINEYDQHLEAAKNHLAQHLQYENDRVTINHRASVLNAERQGHA